MLVYLVVINDVFWFYVYFLSLCFDKVIELVLLLIFYFGKDFSQCVLFGEDWVKLILLVFKMGLCILDLDLEKVFVDGYCVVLSGNFYYGYVRIFIIVDGE